MIIFETVRWRCLLSSGNYWTEVRLTTCQNTMIVGENGAGKSTFLDAICYALFGKPFRKISKPQLVNSMFNKGLLVELEFKVGNRHYMIRRGAKPNVFEIFKDDKLINQAAEMKDYQDMLEKHIHKMTHKSFIQSTLLGSANFTPFMQLSANDRRNFIEDLLDIQVFSRMNVLLKERMRKVEGDIQALEYEIALTENSIEMHNKHLEALSANHQDEIDVKQAKILALREGIQSIQGEIQTLTEALAEANTRLQAQDTVKVQLAKALDYRRTFERKKTKLGSEISFLETTTDCPTCHQPIDAAFRERESEVKLAAQREADEALTKIAEKEAALKIREEDFRKVATEVAEISGHLTRKTTSQTTARTLIKNLDNEIVALNSKLSTLAQDNGEATTLSAKLADQRAIKGNLIADHEIMFAASILLKDGGIKTRIVKQFIPTINKLIAKYLMALDLYVDFTVDENFDEKIKSRFRDEFTYTSFSEGEKQRIDLALMFTWRAIARMRNSSTCNLLVLDEIMDSSLDGDGTEKFLEMLGSLSKDTNVFIISHKSGMTDKFDRVLTFEKVKGFSHMRDAA